MSTDISQQFITFRQEQTFLQIFIQQDCVSGF